MTQHKRLHSLGLGATLCALILAGAAQAQTEPTEPSSHGAIAANDEELGEFVVTGVVREHVPKIAILPSLSSALEDVIVRNVVRRDLEISGLFNVIPDEKAPRGTYGFSDSVDVKAWQGLGAEAIVKVAARHHAENQVEVLGLAYFPGAGAEPVYETRLVVDKGAARRTAHRITDDLLGALTGRRGGFSSRFTFSGAWGRNRRVFAVDADGYGLDPKTPIDEIAIAPAFGPGGRVFYGRSKKYSPFRLRHFDASLDAPASEELKLPFRRSVHSIAFNTARTKLAVAVAVPGGSAIYVGDASGQQMERVSKTAVATHPAFSPSGKLAWVGGGLRNSGQRIYVEGKPVSPAGYSASSPTFCDTEDGIFLVYAVGVGNERSDLVLAGERGQGLRRLTQNQGSNSYPACSPDGRLLAFFSTRNDEAGLYVLSLKRWTTSKVLGIVGESLRWDPLPKETLVGGTAKPSASAEPKGDQSETR